MTDNAYHNQQQRQCAVLAEQLGQLLHSRQQTVATAESCTAGGIAYWLTAIAGSSAWFHGAMVTYTNQLKQQWLGVTPATLAQEGAVSRDCVAQMAAGIRQQTASDWSIAVSGVAGPAGGTIDKPVGLVWFALAGPGIERQWKQQFTGDRQTVREKTIIDALDNLINEIKSAP
ncbi:damage-inducible protein CinA [Idiomarina tyrosinivorans]|uniref:Damage-inducible protein CinA n=1 Tax=Idiomarina tyrosinivorans TaxID=1445662 RepID=A0A432ZRR3_9GAMM|nr:CinA family protein [Idiomarina tyrosinivorans]RUO80615.1 damage-inducible protein CinA [Idiomarina tyrosinivorans]